MLAALCAGVVVADAAPTAAVHAHGNGNKSGNVGAVAELGQRTHGVMARVVAAAAELETEDNRQAPGAAVLAVVESVSPAALAPGHLSRLMALNVPVDAHSAVTAPPPRAQPVSVTAARPVAPPASTGSLPAAVASGLPALPGVVIAPPSTLPPPATFVPSPSGGASAALAVGLIAIAATLAALVSIRLARRPG